MHVDFKKGKKKNKSITQSALFGLSKTWASIYKMWNTVWKGVYDTPHTEIFLLKHQVFHPYAITNQKIALACPGWTNDE